ncbi:MAG: hypothetical protein PUB20_07330 [Clostridia bacterium]|nr:hypothetical protein [Clostridia bacterium]
MKLGKILENAAERFKTDKRIIVIAAVGLLGIALLAASEFIPDNREEPQVEQEQTQDNSVQELEERLTQIITSIDGAGNAKVMITLDTGDENIYAVEDKSSNSEKSGSYDRSYVVIEKDGEESGLLLKVAEPEIRGVAVVCEGADLPEVRSEIVSTVTAVLGVSSNRVSIAKMKNKQ